MSEQKQKRKLKPIEQRALRRKEEGIFERLLCQKLISSNNADALDKILKMAEAVYMHNGKLQNVNKDEVDTLYTVALVFKHAYHYRDGRTECASMTWGFQPTKKNYERYITPWRKVSVRYFTFWPVKDPWHGREYDEAVEDMQQKLATMKGSPEDLKFFMITTNAFGNAATMAEVSFKVLLNEFVMWSIPKVQAWYESLASKIDKDIFDSVLKTMYGPRAPEREGSD